jgi:hypothetical protein
MLKVPNKTGTEPNGNASNASNATKTIDSVQRNSGKRIKNKPGRVTAGK